MSALSTAQDEITKAVDATLQSEARQNEVRLSYVRCLALALVTMGDWHAYVDPAAAGFSQPWLHLPLLSTGSLAVSFVVLIALSRGLYASWFRIALPVADAVVVLAIGGVFVLTLGPEAFSKLGGPGAVGLGAAILIGSSGLRMSPKGTLLMIVVACVIFVVLVKPSLMWQQVFYQLSLLLGLGLLSYWMVGVANRATRSEVARLMLGRFLPDRVVKGAHNDPLSLITRPTSGDATILISDLRDFTAFAEKLAPADVLDYLNEILGSFAAIVRQHGGVVDKFMGDGMLAVFGTPEPLADHAARAIAAARDIRLALERINVEQIKLGRTAVRVGIGIHSGAVVTGCLGAGQRLEFTVIGDTVNTASRLEALTKQHGVDVIVSQETRTRLPAGHDAVFAALGDVALRGRAAPLQVHALK